ncbi:hypothetical protein AB0I61_17130 [Polymorphospora rubra]|uniref:hypothetical protein n=1 Tax=Polymorphospora rubra TaxID=338584 RepID=UPI0033FD154D
MTGIGLAGGHVHSAAVRSALVLLGVAWAAWIILTTRDLIMRRLDAILAHQETVRARQVEVIRRQDHLAARLDQIAEQIGRQDDLLAEVRAEVTRVSVDMRDVLEIRDADAELAARRWAASTPHPESGAGLRVVRGT